MRQRKDPSVTFTYEATGPTRHPERSEGPPAVWQDLVFARYEAIQEFGALHPGLLRFARDDVRAKTPEQCKNQLSVL